MRKKILVGSLVAVSLALGACGSKENVDVKRETTKAVETTTEAAKPVESATEVETEKVEDSDENIDVNVENTENGENSESVENGGEQETLDMSFLDEPVVPANEVNVGTQEITKAVTENLNETPEILGYKMKTVRPFDYYAPDPEGVVDWSKTLSGEYWTGNAIFHSHVAIEGTEEPGYYYDHAHDGPCYIEEAIHVQVYPKEYHDVGWSYEEGEDLGDWLGDQACNMVMGEGSNIEKVNYSVNGRDWTVYYGQMNTETDPKDDFSIIYCDGYFQDENGDYVMVELQHSNHPTLKTDNHVPTASERMETAKQEFETMISTFEKVN